MINSISGVWGKIAMLYLVEAPGPIDVFEGRSFSISELEVLEWVADPSDSRGLPIARCRDGSGERLIRYGQGALYSRAQATEYGRRTYASV